MKGIKDMLVLPQIHRYRSFSVILISISRKKSKTITATHWKYMKPIAITLLLICISPTCYSLSAPRHCQRQTTIIIKYRRVIMPLSDNLAYAWKPMQFSQGAVYLYTDTNMSCKFITYRVYLYTDIG